MKITNKNRKAQAHLHTLQAESMVREHVVVEPTVVQNHSTLVTVTGIIIFTIVLIALLGA
jgi:hypothetical protein